MTVWIAQKRPGGEQASRRTAMLPTNLSFTSAGTRDSPGWAATVLCRHMWAGFLLGLSRVHARGLPL